MKVEKFATGILGTNTYLVINEETKQAVVVDPAALPKRLKNYIEENELTIEAVLLTHAHFDHIMGVDLFEEEYGVSAVYVHENDAEMMESPMLNLSNVYFMLLSVHGLIDNGLDFCKYFIRRQHLAIIIRTVNPYELRVDFALLSVYFADTLLEFNVCLMDVLSSFKVFSVCTASLTFEF